MPKTANNFLKIEMLLLKILSKQECYGYQITQILKSLSNDHISLAEGTLYPILYKLVDLGYIEDKKILVGKRKTRVYYVITDTGRDYLKELYKEYQNMTIYIDKIMAWEGENENVE